MKDTLGDRIKLNYEDRARFYLTRRTPVIIRVDGKAFHTYTKNFSKPFDGHLINGMVSAVKYVFSQIQGCVAAFTQSDEASFLVVDYKDLNSQAWFDYNKSKMETIAASAMTAQFNVEMRSCYRYTLAMFDARSFNIPREEVSNYFLWRSIDWRRNYLSMYCSSFYSHKEMMKKNTADQIAMIKAKGKDAEKDWPAQIRNGTWLISTPDGVEERHDITPSYATISSVLDPLINCDQVAAVTE